MSTFDTSRHMIKVQGGREYLPVAARLIWFRQAHPDWGIVTNIIEINHEKQFAIFQAAIYNAEGKLMATATKKEDIKGFPDYIEKAETGSVGRALAYCGFGTQFSTEIDDGQQGKQVRDTTSAPQATPAPQTRPQLGQGQTPAAPQAAQMVFRREFSKFGYEIDWSTEEARIINFLLDREGDAAMVPPTPQEYVRALAIAKADKEKRDDSLHTLDANEPED